MYTYPLSVMVLCTICCVLFMCAGYEISQRLKKAAFEGALTIGKKKKASKGEDMLHAAYL